MPRLLQALGLPCEQLISDQIATYKRNIRLIPLKQPSWVSAPGEQLSDEPFGFEVTTLHVDRQALDQRLFEIACARETRFIWDQVSKIEIEGERVSACQTRNGQYIVADWYIDASGQARLFAKAFGIPKIEYGHPKVCLWTYFNSAPYNEGTSFFWDDQASGYLRWIWDIPITPETTSVGFIAPAQWLQVQRRNSKTIRQILSDELARHSRFESLLAQQPNFEVLACSFCSYVNQKACGPNWLLVGEAASMPDPLTSNGASAACRHAKEAAQLIRDSREKGVLSKRQIYVYNANVLRMGRAFNHSIERMIYEWPVRRGLSAWLALKVYATFGYLINALYAKFQPQSRLSMLAFGIMFTGVWLCMEGWSLVGKVAFLIRRHRRNQRFSGNA